MAAWNSRRRLARLRRPTPSKAPIWTIEVRGRRRCPLPASSHSSRLPQPPWSAAPLRSAPVAGSDARVCPAMGDRNTPGPGPRALAAPSRGSRSGVRRPHPAPVLRPPCRDRPPHRRRKGQDARGAGSHRPRRVVHAHMCGRRGRPEGRGGQSHRRRRPCCCASNPGRPPRGCGSRSARGAPWGSRSGGNLRGRFRMRWTGAVMRRLK
jgi:hypothetical protein